MMRSLFVAGAVALVLFALPGLVVLAADVAGYGVDINAWLESRFALSHRVALALPAAVALAGVPPLIVLLYFLRLKRKPVAVPSTFLWKKSIEDLHVNRLMQWLRQNVLLLLQVLAALLMIYGVLGPRLHGSILGGKRYILLIDNSASMSATDVAPNRLAWAKAEAIKEIDAATDSDPGLVISFSDGAEIRQSYTTNRGELRAAVLAIQPTQRVTRLDEALALAASLTNPARSTENEVAAPANPEPGKERTYVANSALAADLHLYSDRQFPPVPDFALEKLDLIFHAPPAPPGPPDFPAASDNVAILKFDAERDPEDPTKLTARATVRNYRATAVDIRPRIEVLAEGKQLVDVYDDDETKLTKRRPTLPARAEKPDLVFSIPNVPPGADVVLKLKLEGNVDASPMDDEAWIALGIVRRAKVLIVGPESRPLRAFFDSPAVRTYAEATYQPASVLRSPRREEYLTPIREGVYDLVIYDGCAPEGVDTMPNANTLFIGAVPPPYSVEPGTPPERKVEKVSGAAIRGWQSRHPVMRDLQALDEIELADALRLPNLPPRSQRLIEGSDNLALLTAIPREAYTDLVLAFAILTPDNRFNTTWLKKISFPLFLRNAVLSLGNVRDAASEEATKPGQVKTLRLGGTPRAELVLPDGSTRSLERGSRPDFLVTATDRLGPYAVRYTEPGSSETRVRRFAVNLFDALESDLTVGQVVTVGNKTSATEGGRKTPHDLWKWPVLAGFLVLLFEWWVYNKRVQI